MLRFCDELIARVDRAGATGEKLLRADSGFWAKKTFDRLDRAGWQFSIGVRLQAHVRRRVTVRSPGSQHEEITRMHGFFGPAGSNDGSRKRVLRSVCG